ncbi:MAG TPA: anti-sigma factor [Ktedonobacterales bacterium]|nr:anti-sigma factor [Ktedonobacterales bacterium]
MDRMDRRDSHVDDLIDAYALGALEPDEVDAVERHLETCPRCRVLVARARALADAFLLAVPRIAPSPDLRDRLMRRIAAEAAGSAASMDTSRPTSAPTTTANPVARFLRSLLGGEGETHDAGGLLRDLLADPECVILPVPGTDEAPGASARFVGSPHRSEGVLVAGGLRPSGAGRAYQVWFLHGGQPQPNTVFRADHSGHGAGVFRLDRPVFDFDTVAVTPEPEGGSPAPTGPIVLAGALRRE